MSLYLTGTSEYLQSPCDPGYYCPDGTTSATQYPCPAQTYYNLTMARDVADCLPCPGGEYCATNGLSTPTGLCQQGNIHICSRTNMTLKCFIFARSNFRRFQI